MKIAKQLLVDVAEHVAIVGCIEVDGVDFVDDLTHQRAVLRTKVLFMKISKEKKKETNRELKRARQVGRFRLAGRDGAANDLKLRELAL